MIEKAIFANLISNEHFARKVLPFLKSEYFQSRLDQSLFKIINAYVQEYNNLPSKTALLVEIGEYPELNDDEEKALSNYVKELEVDDNIDQDCSSIHIRKSKRSG